MFKLFCLFLAKQLADLQKPAAANVELIAGSTAAANADKTIAAATELSAKNTAVAVSFVEKPTPAGKIAPTVYGASRWLLLSCYEATHVESVKPARRESLFISLFARCTGYNQLTPPWRYAAEQSRALHDEAISIYRKIGELGSLPTHDKLRRWLLGRPDAMAPRSINPHNFIEKKPQRKKLERVAPIGHTLAFGSSCYTRYSGDMVSEVSALSFYRGHPREYAVSYVFDPVEGTFS